MTKLSAPHGTRVEPAVSAETISVGGGDQTLTFISRGLYVGGTGAIVVELDGDETNTTFSGLVAGQIYPLAIRTVRQTGTTATGLLALY